MVRVIRFVCTCVCAHTSMSVCRCVLILNRWLLRNSIKCLEGRGLVDGYGKDTCATLRWLQDLLEHDGSLIPVPPGKSLSACTLLCPLPVFTEREREREEEEREEEESRKMMVDFVVHSALTHSHISLPPSSPSLSPYLLLSSPLS